MMSSAAGTLDRSKCARIAIFTAIVFLAAALRLSQLGAEDLSYDEVIIVTLTQGEFGPLLMAIWGGRPATLPLLAFLWVRIFGFSEFAVRLLPAYFGILSAALFVPVARRYLPVKGAFLAAFLFALSLFHIFYSQDFRYYSFVTFFTLLSYYCYAKALRRGKFAWFAATSAANILIFYSHAHGGFVLLAQGLHFLLFAQRYRDQWRPWLLHQLITSAGLAQGFFVYLNDFFYFGADIPGSAFSPAQHLLPATARSGLYTLLLQYPFQGSKGADIRLGLFFGSIFASVGLIFWLRRRGWQVWRQDTVSWLTDLTQGRGWRQYYLERVALLGLWLFCPIFVPILLSQFTAPIYLARYTIPALPAAYLLGAGVLLWLRPIIPTRISLIALLPAILLALNTYYLEGQKDEWAPLAQTVAAQQEPGDQALYVSINNEPAARVGQAFNYYFHDELPACGDPGALFPTKEQALALLQSCADAERVWLITRPINDQDVAALAATFAWDENEAVVLLESWHFHKTAAYLLQLQEP